MTTAPPVRPCEHRGLAAPGPSATPGNREEREPGARGAIRAGTAARELCRPVLRARIPAVAGVDLPQPGSGASARNLGVGHGRSVPSAARCPPPASSRTAWRPESPRAWPASSAWRRRAKRRRRVAEPDLDFREFCRRSKLPLLRPAPGAQLGRLAGRALPAREYSAHDPATPATRSGCADDHPCRSAHQGVQETGRPDAFIHWCTGTPRSTGHALGEGPVDGVPSALATPGSAVHPVRWRKRIRR